MFEYFGRVLLNQIETTLTLVGERDRSLKDIGGLSGFTLTGVQGYSGNAAATALAPASFVHSDRPTKNSLPNNGSKLKVKFLKSNNLLYNQSNYYNNLPVNKTSPPSSLAIGSDISIIGKSNSFFNTTLIVSIWKKI